VTTYSRRQFVQGAGVAGVGLLAGCGRLPSVGHSQAHEPAKVPRLALMAPGFREFMLERELGPFRQGLSDLGYTEGQHVVIEARYAEGKIERLSELATELVGSQVAMLVVGGPAAVRAAIEATATIPIVMVGGGNPLATGFVPNLARPGGNVTGLATAPPELTEAKRLELLKETVPSLSRVAFLRVLGANTPQADWAHYEAAALALDLQLQPLEIRGPEDFEAAFDAAARERAEGLLVTNHSTLVANYRVIAELAIRRHLPAISGFRDFAEAQGLIAYGVSIPSLWRRAAYYVDRILKGSQPAALPVEQPREFELVINRQTAQALGITIPPRVLLQATEVIQ
jgi:putative tryptophan/tyrosine transport system substrate-binding protein